MPPPKHSIHSEYEKIDPRNFKCRHCAQHVKSADIVRLMRHTRDCDHAPGATRVNTRTLLSVHSSSTSSRKRLRENSTCTSIIGPSATTTPTPITPQFSLPKTPLESETPPKTPAQSGILQWMDSLTDDEDELLRDELADVIFSTGMPFSIVEHPKFVAFLRRLRPAFRPPTRNAIANKYLDRAYTSMKDKFDEALVKPIKPGRLTLVTDGWTNVRGESIINYMLVTPEGGAYFHSSETAGVNSHTGEFLAQRMMNVIEKVGARHINAICCDSAANQQKAVQLVQQKHPQVFGIKCTSHQLNLVIKDILKLPPFAETMQRAVSLSKWFRNHHIVLEHLKKQQIIFCKKEIALALPVPTRWQSNLDCLTALTNSQKAFEAVVLVDAVEAMMTKQGPKNAKARELLSFIKSTSFWKSVQDLGDVIRPFVQLIISFESNLPRLSTLYGAYKWLIKTSLHNIPYEHRTTVADLLSARWAKMESIELELANVLDPCLDPKHAIPLQAERHGIIGQWLQERYGQSLGGKAYAELLNFADKDGPWAHEFYWTSAALDIGPIRWWRQQFEHTALCQVALDILSITPSSGAAERNWSTFGYIHSKSRNRLGNEKVEKLVFIYSNTNLLSDFQYRPFWFDESEEPGVDEVVGADGCLLDAYEHEADDEIVDTGE